MLDWLYRIARRLWPALDEMPEQRRLVGAGDVLIFLAMAPLALAGLAWLAAVSDFSLFRREWLLCAIFLGLIYLFNRISYFFIVEIRRDRYGSADGSLASMLQWSAVFLLGPTSLWLALIITLINHIVAWRTTVSAAGRWQVRRGLAMEIAATTLAALGALQVYTALGGSYPLSGLSLEAMLPAMAALAVDFILILLVWSGYILYSFGVHRVVTQSLDLTPIARFLFLALGLPVLAQPFSILVAGTYQQNGMPIFLFLIVGMLLVAFLARQLSWAAETSRQHARQVEQLEHLGRDIINAPPDSSTLAELLKTHVPVMFPSGRMAIWLAPDQCTLLHPDDWKPETDALWGWIKDQSSASVFLARERLPWNERAGNHDPAVIAPILHAEDAGVIGFIYIELRSLSQPWDRKALTSLLPAVQALAAQVASALQQAKVYAESLQYHITLQELEFAGRIQSSFFPRDLPSMDGWELAVTLLPARETSGDYFDIFPLAEGKIGVLVADVADKGLGAALYMALSRTLIRTYALEYGMAPEIVFFSVNERILQDASANLFVTAFYGILDPASGVLTFANAGHNPPFLVSADHSGAITALTPTGMPIGVDEDSVWSQNAVQIAPGETLVLYTDGIPDAQDGSGQAFRERGLLDVIQANRNKTAQEMQKSILQEVTGFVGQAPQFDDITLLVIQRDELPDAA